MSFHFLPKKRDVARFFLYVVYISLFLFQISYLKTSKQFQISSSISFNEPLKNLTVLSQIFTQIQKSPWKVCINNFVPNLFQLLWVHGQTEKRQCSLGFYSWGHQWNLIVDLHLPYWHGQNKTSSRHYRSRSWICTTFN